MYNSISLPYLLDREIDELSTELVEVALYSRNAYISNFTELVEVRSHFKFQSTELVEVGEKNSTELVEVGEISKGILH